MDFEWDEDKRQATLEARGLDFAFANQFFDGRPTLQKASPRNGEDRIISVAFVDGGFLTLVWLARGNKIRIISLRRSRVAEERAYRQLHN